LTRLFNTKGWSVLGAVLVLFAAIIASAVTASHRPSASAAMAPAGRASSELDRCRSLGADAAKDAGCQAAWRLLRDHFLGLDKTGARL